MDKENTTNKPTEEELERARMPWEEITDSERIERLRYIIRQDQNRIGKMQRELDELRDEIREHRHGNDDKVLLPASMRNRGYLNAGCCKSAGPNHKPWF